MHMGLFALWLLFDWFRIRHDSFETLKHFPEISVVRLGTSFSQKLQNAALAGMIDVLTLLLADYLTLISYVIAVIDIVLIATDEVTS